MNTLSLLNIDVDHKHTVCIAKPVHRKAYSHFFYKDNTTIQSIHNNNILLYSTVLEVCGVLKFCAVKVCLVLRVY